MEHVFHLAHVVHSFMRHCVEERICRSKKACVAAHQPEKGCKIIPKQFGFHQSK